MKALFITILTFLSVINWEAFSKDKKTNQEDDS